MRSSKLSFLPNHREEIQKMGGDEFGKHLFPPTSRLFVSGRSWSYVDHREDLFFLPIQLFLPSSHVISS